MREDENGDEDGEEGEGIADNLNRTCEIQDEHFLLHVRIFTETRVSWKFLAAQQL